VDDCDGPRNVIIANSGESHGAPHGRDGLCFLYRFAILWQSSFARSAPFGAIKPHRPVGGYRVEEAALRSRCTPVSRARSLRRVGVAAYDRPGSARYAGSAPWARACEGKFRPAKGNGQSSRGKDRPRGATAKGRTRRRASPVTPPRPTPWTSSACSARHREVHGRGARAASQPYQPSPKGSSGRPAHRPFRGSLGVHSRCGLHTRAATNSWPAIPKASATWSPP